MNPEPRTSVSASIRIEEVYRLIVDGKVLKSITTVVPRDFSTYDAALAFGAALLETGHAKEVSVNKIFRSPRS